MWMIIVSPMPISLMSVQCKIVFSICLLWPLFRSLNAPVNNFTWLLEGLIEGWETSSHISYFKLLELASHVERIRICGCPLRGHCFLVSLFLLHCTSLCPLSSSLHLASNVISHPVICSQWGHWGSVYLSLSKRSPCLTFTTSFLADCINIFEFLISKNFGTSSGWYERGGEEFNYISGGNFFYHQNICKWNCSSCCSGHHSTGTCRGLRCQWVLMADGTWPHRPRCRRKAHPHTSSCRKGIKMETIGKGYSWHGSL